MRFARKLALLAMLAIAATALATPSAFAQTEPELHNQAPRIAASQEIHGATDAACPAVTPNPPPAVSPTTTAGGCRLHFAAPLVILTAHLSAGGTEVTVGFATCSWEFDLRIDPDGEGWISHQEFTPGASGTCTRRACGQLNPPASEGRAYTAYMQEREIAGQGAREEVVIVFCTQNLDGTGGGHCEITVPISQPSLHRYRFTAVDVSGHGTAFPHCELTGTFDEEAVLGTTGENQTEQRVEIRHT
jgi:hypothetical protein